MFIFSQPLQQFSQKQLINAQKIQIQTAYSTTNSALILFSAYVFVILSIFIHTEKKKDKGG